MLGRITGRHKDFTYYNFWFTWLSNTVFNLFRFTGVPPDMETSIKLSFCIGGKVVFFRHGGEVYALDFVPGGKIGVYPVAYTIKVVNPKLPQLPDFTPYVDCVPVYMNQTDAILGYGCGGFYGLIHRTAMMLSENDMTIENVEFTKRLPVVFTARTDQDYTGIVKMLDNIKRGLREIVSRVSLNGSVERLAQGADNVKLSDFTEFQQYIIGNFYNQIGVNATWNMKRERVQASETDQNDETARYNIVQIFENLRAGLDKVNEMFGTDYGVTLNIEDVRQDEQEGGDGENDGDHNTDETDNSGSGEETSGQSDKDSGDTRK